MVVLNKITFSKYINDKKKMSFVVAIKKEDFK